MEELIIKEIEYETIALESEGSIVFRINGTVIEIPRESILDYDLQGRLYLTEEDAERFGLRPSS